MSAPQVFCLVASYTKRLLQIRVAAVFTMLRANNSVAVVFTLMFWFAGSLANNLTTKAALQSFPYPFFLAFIGLCTQTLIFGMQTLVCSRKECSSGELKDDSYNNTHPPVPEIAPISLGVVAAFTGHRLALQHSSVSFTLTVKSVGTILVAILSLCILRTRITWLQWSALIAVMSGISLATYSESEFSTFGFTAALMSACGQALQVVWTKRTLQQSRWAKAIVRLNASVLAVLIMLPAVIYVEGAKIFVQISAHDIANPSLNMALLSGLCLAWMELGAYLFLMQVSPVTHGVCNGLRSVFTILACVVYFGKTISLVNIAGIVIAVCGITLYGAVGAASSRGLAKRPKTD